MVDVRAREDAMMDKISAQKKQIEALTKSVEGAQRLLCIVIDQQGGVVEISPSEYQSMAQLILTHQLDGTMLLETDHPTHPDNEELTEEDLKL